MRFAIRCAAWSAIGAFASVAAAATVAAQSYPQFRDSRTGTLWTPQRVEQDNRLSRDNSLEPSNQPSIPADNAFRPHAQIVTAKAITVQRPRANVMGTVPITAGPNVPVVTIDSPSLQAIPGDRWLTVLYVTNNSATAVQPQIGCTFTNGSRSVQEARVIVPTTAPGARLGVPVYGPRTDIFVDRVLCRVLAPS